MMSAQVGGEVILSDKRRGKILLINPNYPTSPLVAVEGGFVDLSQDKTITIKEIIG